MQRFLSQLLSHFTLNNVEKDIYSIFISLPCAQLPTLCIKKPCLGPRYYPSKSMFWHQFIQAYPLFLNSFNMSRQGQILQIYFLHYVTQIIQVSFVLIPSVFFYLIHLQIPCSFFSSSSARKLSNTQRIEIGITSQFFLNMISCFFILLLASGNHYSFFDSPSSICIRVSVEFSNTY